MHTMHSKLAADHVRIQVFLAGHMPSVAFYTLAAVEAVAMTVTAAKVTGLLDRLSSNGGIWQAYLDSLGVLAVAVLVQVSENYFAAIVVMILWLWACMGLHAEGLLGDAAPGVR